MPIEVPCLRVGDGLNSCIGGNLKKKNGGPIYGKTTTEVKR